MAFPPTDEQQHILSLGSQGEHLVIEALAGTGKTTTLEMLSHRLKGKGLYLAFNRSIAKEAQRRFASNVTCRTIHGYAFAQLGYQFAERLEGADNGQLSAMRIERALSLRPLGNVSPLARATLIRETFAKFLQSADDNVSTDHLPETQLALLFPPGTSAHHHARNEIAQDATTLWEMLWQPRSRLPVGHDCYLKAFALTRPKLPFDFLTVDEGQDLSPLMIELVSNQDAQRITVGDSHQQIYAWRGATNALDKVPNAKTCYLTQSFRFGNEIATQANIVLGTLKAQKPVRGFEANRDDLRGVNAILFRSNMGLFGELMTRMVKNGQQCHIAGGAKDMVALLSGVADLKAGKPTAHPDLAGFSSWASFRSAAEQDGAPREMKQLVKVVSSYPEKALMFALSKGSRTKEQDADIILSTAHKAKGREFPDVFIGPDFPAPSPTLDDPEMPFEPEEARLAYVGLTRAQRRLKGHENLVGAYRARLDALIEAQKNTAEAKSNIKLIFNRLQKMTPDQKRDAIKSLTHEEKKALNEFLS